jgi:hypothetical protein
LHATVATKVAPTKSDQVVCSNDPKFAPGIFTRGSFLLLWVGAMVAALPCVMSAEAPTKAPALAHNADLTIVRVFTGWREAASFKRISEYFDHQENPGGEIVLRTHPEERAGYYFLLRVRNPGAPLPVKLGLLVISAANAQPASFTFAADLKAGDTVLNLGLTGADWSNAKRNPVAWKLEIQAADGRILATEKSYLWEKPAAN